MVLRFVCWLLALSLSAAELPDLVPMRWISTDPASLKLLDGAPVNCLLLEAGQLDAGLIAAARARNLTLFGVLRQASEAEAAAKAALDGLVVEGDDEAARKAARATGARVLEMPSRIRVPYSQVAFTGTTEGLWPGLHVEKDGKAKAAPTGAPWIETNIGYLRYLRAAAGPDAVLWMGVRPPEGAAWGPARYEQAVADAAQCGARWVAAMDSALARSLAASDARALAHWKRLTAALAFYEKHRAYARWTEFSELALVQDVVSGALYSGGFADMIVARNIPAGVVPGRRVLAEPFTGVKMVLNIDPAGLSAEEKEKLLAVARQGGTLVNGPPGWKVPPGEAGVITMPESLVKRADEAWREINSFLGRRNFGVRVFGAPGAPPGELHRLPDREHLAALLR